MEDDGWGLSGPTAYGSRGGEGLSLVRGLIERHAGTLSLCRREGGMLASVELPLP